MKARIRLNQACNMNSLSDILSQKADILFPEDEKPEEKNVAKDEGEKPDRTENIRRMVHHMQNDLSALLRLLDDPSSTPFVPSAEGEILASGERVGEGTFTGEKMQGDDGKEYTVPANYASKSKLVHGDRLKLTITKSGSFIYKQIGP